MDEKLLQARLKFDPSEGENKMQNYRAKFEGKVILVTGGAGCIGSNLIKSLLNLNVDRILVFDDFSSSYTWNIPTGPKIITVRGSILNEDLLNQVYKHHPDIVYHLAAHFANQNSVEHPELDLMVNGMGTLKVLEHARTTDVERFVYTSSGCGSYGLDSKIPFEEQDVSISLYTPYQITKLLGELYTNYFHNLYHLPIVNARLFNVYGPGEVPGKYRNVIPNFFYWAFSGLPLPITGDGSETRDWTYVSDITNGLLAMGLVKDAIGEAINLGSGVEHRVIDMANMINKLTGNKAGIKFIPRRDWDVKKRLLSNIDKAKTILNYKPEMLFNKGLEMVYEWFLGNMDNIKKCAEF